MKKPNIGIEDSPPYFAGRMSSDEESVREMYHKESPEKLTEKSQMTFYLQNSVSSCGSGSLKIHALNSPSINDINMNFSPTKLFTTEKKGPKLSSRQLILMREKLKLKVNTDEKDKFAKALKMDRQMISNIQ